MFNLDKILKRSLVKDIAKMEEMFEYYIKIDNGIDMLYVYLTKKELKRLLKKDEFGNESLNIPDKKVQKLWREYYEIQDNMRSENIKDASLDDIPKVGDKKYIDYADYLTVEEWMQVVNHKAVFTDTNGRISISPIVVLEDFKIERLFNRTDVADCFIYNVKSTMDGNYYPLTFAMLKELAKVIPKTLLTITDYDKYYKSMITKDEFDKIQSGEIVLFQSKETLLFVSTTD